MPILILLIIAVLWALYLVPLWLRSRGGSSRGSVRMAGVRGASTGAIFPRSSSPAFARSGLAVPSRPGAPRTAAEARRRRREVLMALGGAAVVTLLLGLLVGGIFWVLHLLVDIALVGFGYLVHEHETRAQERAAKVRPLPTERRVPRQAPAGEELRRRAAN